MLVESRIQQKLTEQFEPTVLLIENESHRHSSGRGAESHFKVTMVSPKFDGLRSVARHQAVYGCLREELEQGLHALALHLFTQAEWQAQGEVVPASTNCVGHGA